MYKGLQDLQGAVGFTLYVLVLLGTGRGLMSKASLQVNKDFSFILRPKMVSLVRIMSRKLEFPV